MDNDAVFAALAGRGGRLQFEALGAEYDPGEGDDDKCDLVDALLYLFGWGLLSLPNINWLARCAVKAGAAHHELTLLAELGAHGLYPGNMRRDLLRNFCKGEKVPRPIEVSVIAKDPLMREVEVSQSVINLPELLQAIWDSHEDKFKEIMGSNTRAFWDALDPDDPKLEAMSDLMRVPGWQDISYPCTLHGDAGLYAKKTQSSILVVSIKSMLSDAFSDHIIPAFVLPNHIRNKGVGGDTADEMWRAYINCLNAAYDGVHPPTDHRGRAWAPGSTQEVLAGSPLCGGRVRIVVFAIAGDLEYLSVELGFPHFNSNNPCWFCPASRDALAPHSISDMARDASWKNHLANPVVDVFSPVTGHPIHTLKNFTRFLAPGDLMHTGPLGVAAWFLGSALWELCFDGPWGGTVEERLEELWQSIVSEYDAQGTRHRLTMIVLGLFYHGPNKFTCFTGKASEALALLYVLRELCADVSTGSQRDTHRLVCFESLCHIFTTVKKSGHTIARFDAEAMLKSCERFLAHYNWLAVYSLRRSRMNYHVVTKTHMLWHICYHARYLNPRVTWCFEFEDYVGVMIRCAKSCMAGSPLFIVGRKCLENSLLLLQMRLR